MEKKYTALRFIAMSMKVLGLVVAALTILAAVGICGTSFLGGAILDRITQELGQNTSGAGTLLGLLWGLIAMIVPIILGGSLALILFAGGDALYIQINIEENTRATTWYLRQQARVFSKVFPNATQPPLAPATAGALEGPGNLPRNFCPRCGAQVSAADENCPQCGHALR